jgi:cytidyltransferase-like protein
MMVVKENLNTTCMGFKEPKTIGSNLDEIAMVSHQIRIHKYNQDFNMRKVVIVSGYFNPLHKGHLELFRTAREFSDDYLIVIVNSDLQRELKGSKEFQDENERLEIIKSIKYVSEARISQDLDKTQCETLRQIYNDYGKIWDLHFANGGDQDNKSIPESLVCEKLGIKLIDGLGDKIQSSSWLLK